MKVSFVRREIIDEFLQFIFISLDQFLIAIEICQIIGTQTFSQTAYQHGLSALSDRNT